MANINKFKDSSGVTYDVEDVTARSVGDAASTEAEYDRQDATGTYPGRSLLEILGATDFDGCVAKLHTKASTGDFSGLRVMDYIDVTPTKVAVNQGNALRYRIGSFDYGYQYGDQPTPHSIAFVPDTPVDITGSSYAVNTSNIPWNTSNTNQGTKDQSNPYLASNLHKWELQEFLPALPASLQHVLIDHRVLLESRYSASGALEDSTGWDWGSVGKIFSLSETEVYGLCVWGTKGYSVGSDEQWDIFRKLRGRGMRFARNNWWLRSVRGGSSSNVCYVSYNGIACADVATGGWIRPLPCFLIG